jgi:predicted DNA-binding transcriptional regulator YafY
VPATLAELADEDGTTVLRMRADSLEWVATVLAGLGCDFSIRRPDELRTSVRDLGARLARSA